MKLVDAVIVFPGDQATSVHNRLERLRRIARNVRILSRFPKTPIGRLRD